MGGIQYWFSCVTNNRLMTLEKNRCFIIQIDTKLNAANKYEPDLSAQQMYTAVKWHMSPLSNFPNPCSLLLSSLGPGSNADIFTGGGLEHCSCSGLVSDWWLHLALSCSEITYLCFGAKVSSSRPPVTSQAICVVLVFLWKANLFLPFFFSFLKWRLFGDCGVEY